MSLFNPEFYPTPIPLIERMGIEPAGKIILEPSAGSGHIVDWLNAGGAARVLSCEVSGDLRRIVSTKSEFLCPDFFDLTADRISHVNMIVMNPPFSNGAAHILHAFKIAPEGCEVIALCNYATVQKDHYAKSKELTAIISNYGEFMDMGEPFREADRTTPVRVALVRLFKPMLTENDGFEDFYLHEEGLDQNATAGIVGYNEIQAVVNTYVSAVRCFEKVEAVAAELSQYTSFKHHDSAGKECGFKYGYGVSFAAQYRNNHGNTEGITTKREFAAEYQRKCWRYIFDRVGIERFVTQSVLADVNKFIESRQNYPFTVKNIFKMLEIIVGTRENTMNRAITEAVDSFTQATHENRHGVEGWKTNAGHLLGKKFITGRLVTPNYMGGLRIDEFRCPNYDYINDLTKALCFVTGKSFDTVGQIQYASAGIDTAALASKSMTNNHNHFIAGQWYQWGFFEFKVYKKGSAHFKFKNAADWEALNRAYAKIKGQVLPEKI